MLELRMIVGGQAVSPERWTAHQANDNKSREQMLFERAVAREMVDDRAK